MLDKHYKYYKNQCIEFRLDMLLFPLQHLIIERWVKKGINDKVEKNKAWRHKGVCISHIICIRKCLCSELYIRVFSCRNLYVSEVCFCEVIFFKARVSITGKKNACNILDFSSNRYYDSENGGIIVIRNFLKTMLWKINHSLF